MRDPQELSENLTRLHSFATNEFPNGVNQQDGSPDARGRERERERESFALFLAGFDLRQTVVAPPDPPSKQSMTAPYLPA